MTLILVAILLVAVFVVGISLTLILKGHNIRSEIGDNPHMKERGIECAASQMRKDEACGQSQTDCVGDLCSDGDCRSCGSNN